MFRSLSTLVLLLLLALPGIALAQGTGTLAGRVVDAASGETLIGANVRVDGTSLGAATDLDGNFRVIGVPVGTYSVTASYTGYEANTLEDVVINNGYTREVAFQLSSGELGTVYVDYERPIIQRDAIGTPRVATGEELQNLPIRGVAAVAATTGGVVNTEGSGTLNVRGGRGEEVAYFVDGVRVSGSALVGVNQQAIQEQELLIGTIPARYGDVQSGVISITTKTGRQDFFGSAEFITSTGLDSYGYNLGSLSLGGPIVPGRAGFFLSGEVNTEDDTNPYGSPILRLNDDAYAQLQATPQAIEVTAADGSTRFVTFDPSFITGAGIGIDSLTTLYRTAGLITASDTLLGTSLTDGAELFASADQFSSERGKDDPLRDLTLNGNLNFDLGAIGLRLGGGYATRRREIFSYTGSLYNRDAFNNDERDSYRVYGTFRQRLSNTVFYQLQGEFQDFQFVSYPEGFSGNVEDALNYGDAQDARNEAARNYYVFRNGGFTQQFNTDSGARPGRVSGLTFSLPGRNAFNTFQQAHQQQYRFSGNATTQVGVHQIEFGGEYQQETRRSFSVAGFGLAAYAADGTVETPLADFPDGVSSYDQLPFDVLRNRVSYFGYNYNGTEEVDDQDIDGFFPDANGMRSNTDLAPYRPRYFAGYVQDKIEFNDLVIQLGLRVDAFDNNTSVLRDVYAPIPIVRAGTLASVPNGVESDWAVYYAGTNVVGYRDLDGNFYDSQGTQTTNRQIVTVAGGQVQTTGEPISAAFEPYEAQVTVMPRVGVSFPVTDRALFFASYNVTSQRPTEFAFAPLSDFEELDGQTRTANPRLKPEITTQYEIGFRQRLGEQAAISLAGFYRTQENKITVRPVVGGFPAYSTYFNADFTTTQGVEANFDLRRSRNLAMTANYTLSFAAGTGSDATSTGTAAWRGTLFPQSINPADFDQRHTANVSVDYRFGAGEGPMFGNVRPFENFGINLLGQFGSGQRYTVLAPNTGFNINDTFTTNTLGDINSATLPATSRIDLRVERQFNLGLADSRLRAYVNVTNLLDTQNVLAVYRTTGVADNDGFAALDPAVLATDGDRFNYEQFISGPVNVGGSQSTGNGQFYSAPRQIRLGFLFDF